MFRATCDNCHQSCEVPFRPSGDKPVYCSDCFEKMGKGGTQTRRTESGGPGGQKDLTGQFKQLNAKLDAILSALTIKPAAIQEKKPAKTAAVKSPKASKKKRAK
jgi:CxxC-x17-CxxC domain-containing protein